MEGEVSAQWRKTSQKPLPLRRIIALYSDGSGGQVFYVNAGGDMLDEKGSDDVMPLDSFTYWTYLPPDFPLFFEKEE